MTFFHLLNNFKKESKQPLKRMYSVADAKGQSQAFLHQNHKLLHRLHFLVGVNVSHSYIWP